MNLDDHHMVFPESMIEDTKAVFHLLGGKDWVLHILRTAREHRSKEVLETKFRLLGGNLRISLEFDQTNQPCNHFRVELTAGGGQKHCPDCRKLVHAPIVEVET